MSSLLLLDQALALGEKELSRLRAGEVDDTQAMAQERERLINLAWGGADSSMSASVKEKLLLLQEQQKQLTGEARRLHAILSQNLKDARQQTTRFSGYAKTVRPGRLASRFINKQS